MRWSTRVPEAGDYVFEGIFLGPQGQHLATVDMVATLEAGVTDLTSLVRLWRQAEMRGDIYTRGLFRSELNRLVRAEQHLAADDADAPPAELARFLDHVTTRQNKFDPTTRSQLMGYTTSLLAELQW